MRRGGVIAYPTESVYGLGCDPLNADAVLRLLAVKNRRPDKGLILIADSFTPLLAFVEYPDPAVMERIRKSWPGPTSWLLPARVAVPDWLTGGRRTIAVRVTAHPLAAALCGAYGRALVSTSANRTGVVPARTALGVRRSLGGAVDYILPGQVGGDIRPSEIRDALTDRVIRAGPQAGLPSETERISCGPSS